MIKILELIDGGFIGGGQTHILSICRNLDKEKYLPIIAASPKGEFKELTLKENIRFYDVKLPKIYRGKYLKELKTIIDKEKVDIIHAHGGVAGMYAKFYKKKIGNIKVIHSIHGIHYIHSKNILRKSFSKTIEQYLVNFADMFLCASDEDIKVGSEFKIINKEKTKKVSYGIDLKKFERKLKEYALLKELGISENNFVIGNISRFDEQKNQKILIDIFPYLVKTIPTAILLLIGEGKLLRSAKRQVNELGIKDKVIFAGTRKDLEKIYPLIDVFVFPSKWEGLSITLMEALSAGCSIIASKIPQNIEMIEDNVNGMIFNLINKEELKNKIVELYNNIDFKNKLSLGAIYSSDKYNDKVMTKKIEEIYFNLMNN